jgi:hypothetical protein
MANNTNWATGMIPTSEKKPVLAAGQAVPNPFGSIFPPNPTSAKTSTATNLPNPAIKPTVAEQKIATVGTVMNPQTGLLEKPIKKEVGMLSPENAIPELNQKKTYLDTTYPQISDANLASLKESNARLTSLSQQGLTLPTKTPATPAPVGKAYFTNEMGQEAEYTQEQLNDPAIQNFLKNNGYVLAKSDGVNVSSDFTTNAKRDALKESNDQIESLTRDFLSYNVDQDPDFQAQAQSITQKYSKLQDDMMKLNEQRAKSLQTLGMRYGTTQYAGGIQSSIEGEELTQANRRLSDITTQESDALSSARLAFKEGKYTDFSNQVDALQTIRNNKAEELKNYTTAITKLNDKIAEDLKNEKQQAFEREQFDFEVYKYENDAQIALEKAKADEAKAIAEGRKPMVVAPGSSLYDPETGEFMGSAPEKPEKGEIIKGDNGEIFRYDPNTNEMTLLYKSAEDAGISETAMNWAIAIQNGSASLKDITGEGSTELKGQILSLNLPPKQEDLTKVQTKVSEIEALKNHKGMDTAVGVYGINRLAITPFAKGQQNDFIASIDQLVGQKALDALINAKNSGATFGALSDAELTLLKNSATKLNGWARNKYGDPVKEGELTAYYEIDEKTFTAELDKFEKEYQAILDKYSSQSQDPQQKIIDYGNKNPVERENIKNLKQKGYTDEQILEYYDIPFSSESQTSLNGNAKSIASAIKQVESGGNYSAKGGSGEYGAYQFMPSTWSGWAKTYLGNANAPMTQANQDKVAEAKINDLLKQGYNAKEIALIWNGGTPVVKKGTNKYGVAYDSGAYANKVLSALKA